MNTKLLKLPFYKLFFIFFLEIGRIFHDNRHQK
jgi:hypothetical protein